MHSRVLALVLAVCLTAMGQTTLTIEKLSTFLKNSTADSQHKVGDVELASYLSTRVKLSERLDDQTIEALQSRLTLGPKTMTALRRLRDQSQSLPAAVAAAPPEALPPIPIPSAEEQAAILDDVRKYALNYSQNLPDFICTEVEQRFGAPPARSGTPSWRQQDELTKRLSYFAQKEDYRLVMHNNTIALNQDVKSVGGSQSFGDFGTMLKQVFEPMTAAHFEWDAWRTLRGQRVMGFKYRVAVERSQWHVQYDRDRDIITAYHGWFDVNPTTHEVMRIAVVAENIPPDFPVKSASDILDYDYQELSGQTFLLPSKADIEMSVGDFMTKNHKEFRVYRKYSADAVIKYDSDLTADPDCKDPKNKDLKECKQAPIKH